MITQVDSPDFQRSSTDCPLCGGHVGQTLSKTPFRRIWSSLCEQFGDVFGEEIVERHTPAAEVVLFRCACCGLDYFYPAVAGGAEFYSRLTSSEKSTYYTSDKWDFHAALDFVRPSDSIMDIACGEGSWLRMAAAKGAKAFGIDSNPVAVSTAARAGLLASCTRVEEASTQFADRFDVVTAFQLIEHIPDVRNFVDAATRCVKPGGLLLITVPNRERTLRLPFEPLDYPPHHMSRWSVNQLRYLAQQGGLKLESAEIEPARMSDCRAALRERISPVGKSSSIWARAIGRVVFDPWLYAFYLRAGLLERWGLKGMSIMGVFRKAAR